MTASGPDLHQTLEYRTATAMARLLPTGLFLIFVGLFIFALLDADREPLTLIGVALCLLAGCGVIGVALWRRSRHGKPLFALSPAGLHYRIPWVKERLIPWREIRGVETTAVEAGYWTFASSTSSGNWIPRYQTVTFHDVTVVTVSKQFYDAQIFVRSALLRGPGWNANFIPKGELVQIALHHEIVSVEPQALRAAVEARWLAFRERSPVAATRTSVPVTAARAADRDCRGDGRESEDDVALGRGQDHGAADRHRRRAHQHRRRVGPAGTERGSHQARQGARGAEILGGRGEAKPGGVEEARGGRPGATAKVRRRHAARVRPLDRFPAKKRETV
jgi:hypothetical protein